MVDKDDAPSGCVAVESPNKMCLILEQGYVKKCFFWDTKNYSCNNASPSYSCHPPKRKDGKSVIFLPALTGSKSDTAILDELASAEIEIGIDVVDGAHAPAGMAALPAKNGCQGCFYLKGKADCVRTSSISCTSLGRPDESNVIFVPR